MDVTTVNEWPFSRYDTLLRLLIHGLVFFLWFTNGCAEAPSRLTETDQPFKTRGYLISPPSYLEYDRTKSSTNFNIGLLGSEGNSLRLETPKTDNNRKAPTSWLEPWSDAPSPPSHTYTGTDFSQDPDPPYILLIGEKKRDFSNNSRIPGPDGIRDTWLRFYPRNLEFYLKRDRGTGSQRWPCVKALILRTRGEGSMRQWDTLPGSIYPLLEVSYGETLLNKGDGSIAGFCPPGHSYVDIYIGGDAGAITGRHIPMEFQIITPDGGLKLEVRRTSVTGILD